MQKLNNRIGKEKQEQVKINQIIKDYKLLFPCSRCEKEINDSHFNHNQQAFHYINESIRKIILEEVRTELNNL